MLRDPVEVNIQLLDGEQRAPRMREIKNKVFNPTQN